MKALKLVSVADLASPAKDSATQGELFEVAGNNALQAQPASRLRLVSQLDTGEIAQLRLLEQQRTQVEQAGISRRREPQAASEKALRQPKKALRQPKAGQRQFETMPRRPSLPRRYQNPAVAGTVARPGRALPAAGQGMAGDFTWQRLGDWRYLAEQLIALPWKGLAAIALAIVLGIGGGVAVGLQLNPFAADGGYTSYTVTEGETLESIASAVPGAGADLAGVMEDISAVNHLQAQALVAGMSILVPTSANG